MFDTNIKSIVQLLRQFPDEDSCLRYLEQIRWDGIPVSPFDESSRVYKCKGLKYKCKNTRKYFNVKTGTMYDNTKLPLQKWFLAIWLLTCHKKGVSSYQLAKDLDVTQQTAWFLAQRIRKNFGIENYHLLDGVVEVDETFYGGKNRNRHRDKKVPHSQGRSYKDKIPVLGMLKRSGKLTAIVVPNTQQNTLQHQVKKYVRKESTVYSDEWQGYKGLHRRYNHQFVDHARKIYVNLHDRNVHSNTIENFWNHFKRSASGMYNRVSKKHLQLYVDESVYRRNMRKYSESDKFNWLLLNCGVRTKYKDLIL